MFSWDYDRNEIVADGVVHAIGIGLALLAVGNLLTRAAPTTGVWEYAAATVYSIGLVGVLTVSAIYNLWPVSPLKWVLRRYDHSTIFIMIAGTYTPFAAQMEAGEEAVRLLSAVWLAAAIGITLKLRYPGRFDRISILLYLLMSWGGVAAYDSIFGILPGTTLTLLLLGGILYTTGVGFHLWERLRFHNAIWHLFVLAGAALHYAAVLDCLVFTRI